MSGTKTAASLSKDIEALKKQTEDLQCTSFEHARAISELRVGKILNDDPLKAIRRRELESRVRTIEGQLYRHECDHKEQAKFRTRMVQALFIGCGCFLAGVLIGAISQ